MSLKEPRRFCQEYVTALVATVNPRESLQSGRTSQSTSREEMDMPQILRIFSLQMEQVLGLRFAELNLLLIMIHGIAALLKMVRHR